MTEFAPKDHWQVTIRERLLVRGASLEWSELWPEVVSMRCELLAALGSISEEQAAWKPAAEDWSIAETIRHLLPSSAGVIGIIEALASGRDPGKDTPYDSPGDLTAHEVAPGYDGSFASLIGALIYVLLAQNWGHSPGNVGAAALVTLGIRLIALRWHLTLPLFPHWHHSDRQ